MKWYFATNVHGMKRAWDLIQAAVLSCRANTRLRPVCLLDDDGMDGATRKKVQWLKDRGVRIIRHRASMLDVLTPVFGEQMKTFSGHWLRCDIPELETKDEFVLYTDIDVVFMRNIPRDYPRPRFIACGPEHRADDYSYFNSGVMIINIPNMRAAMQEFKEVVVGRLAITAPHDDQRALNQLFAGRWDHLPPEWNWKPYWGRNSRAIIVHFHGPKPRHARLLADPANSDRFGDTYRIIYNRDPKGYKHYIRVFDDILAADMPAAPPV